MRILVRGNMYVRIILREALITRRHCVRITWVYVCMYNIIAFGPDSWVRCSGERRWVEDRTSWLIGIVQYMHMCSKG